MPRDPKMIEAHQRCLDSNDWAITYEYMQLKVEEWDATRAKAAAEIKQFHDDEARQLAKIRKLKA